MDRSVFLGNAVNCKLATVFAGVLLISSLQAALAAHPQTRKAELRTEASGYIDSLDPCGGESGAGGEVTFTAKATFAGVGIGATAEKHTITLKLLVIDEDGNRVCSSSQSWDVANAEQGCIKCPVVCKKEVDAGVYFLSATLTDQGPDGKKIKLDAKSCALILTE